LDLRAISAQLENISVRGDHACRSLTFRNLIIEEALPRF
jgi:hypothetical protein